MLRFLVWLCMVCAAHCFTIKVGTLGDYAILINNQTWLTSSSTFFRAAGFQYSTADSTLLIQSTSTGEGTDNLGKWNSISFTYKAFNASMYFETTIKQYVHMDVVAFGQRFHQNTPGTAANSSSDVISSFPSFHVPNHTAEVDLGYYAAAGYMAGDDKKEFGRWQKKYHPLSEHGIDTGPLALYDGSGHTVLISHLTNFMSASIAYNHHSHSVHYGILGQAESVPADYELWTILTHSSHGVNKAFKEWGGLMQKFYKSKNAELAENDFTCNYLGYWTDNGGFYYYNTEKHKSYEETIVNIKKYAEHERIPYRYFQLDSWFYPKQGGTSGGGILEWTPDTKLFPSGVSFIQKTLNWPITAHSKWWSPITPLAKQNNGTYDFVVEKKMALPIDQQLWMDIFSIARSWGLQYYEQDWLGQMFNGLEVLRTNVTIGRTWMLQMAEGLKQNGLLMQQCTSHPRHVLTGLEMGMVTQQRSTMDYEISKNNWQAGITALWVSSLGQRPFKDVFWTTANQSCPRYPGLNEHNPELQSAVSSLLRGPVGPGDAIGKTNRTILMRCCNDDGLILKPDHTITAIDDQFYQTSFDKYQGQIWSTSSIVSNQFFGIVFAAEVDHFILTPRQAGFHEMPQSYIYQRDMPWTMQPFSESSSLNISSCTEHDFCLFYTSPIFIISGVKLLILGETEKWVPLSNHRISSLVSYTDHIDVTLTGAIDEVVTFSVIYDLDNEQKLTKYRCSVARNHQVTLVIPEGTCRTAL